MTKASMYDPHSIVYIFSNLKFVEYNDLRVQCIAHIARGRYNWLPPHLVSARDPPGIVASDHISWYVRASDYHTYHL